MVARASPARRHRATALTLALLMLLPTLLAVVPTGAAQSAITITNFTITRNGVDVTSVAEPLFKKDDVVVISADVTVPDPNCGVGGGTATARAWFATIGTIGAANTSQDITTWGSAVSVSQTFTAGAQDAGLENDVARTFRLQVRSWCDVAVGDNTAKGEGARTKDVRTDTRAPVITATDVLTPQRIGNTTTLTWDTTSLDGETFVSLVSPSAFSDKSLGSSAGDTAVKVPGPTQFTVFSHNGSDSRANDGVLDIVVRVVDDAGNEKDITWKLAYDNERPEVQSPSLKFDGGPAAASPRVNLSWTASDADTIPSVTVERSTTSGTTGFAAVPDAQVAKFPGDTNFNTRARILDAATGFNQWYRVRLTDNAGNAGAEWSTVVTPPSVALTSHAHDAPIPRVLADEFSGSNVTGATVSVFLYNGTSDSFLPCDGSGAWVTRTSALVAEGLPGVLECSANVTATGWNHTDWNGVDLGPDARSLTFGVIAEHGAATSTVNHTFILDPALPVFQSDGTTIPENQVLQQTVNRPVARINATEKPDEDPSGLVELRLSLRDKAGNVKTSISGQELVEWCADGNATKCGLNAGDLARTVALQRDIKFPDGLVLPLGTYFLHAEIKDAAGNSRSKFFNGNKDAIAVNPRAFVPTKAAWISEDDVFTASTWAGYSNLTYTVGNQQVSCEGASKGHLCPVKHVQYYAWNPTAGAYSTSPFLTTTQRVGGAEKASNDAWYYNYTDSVELSSSLSNLNPFKFMSKVVVEVPRPGGGTYSYTTEVKDLFATRAGVPDLAINFPKEWATNVSETPSTTGVAAGDVVFNATITFGQWEALFGSGDSRQAPYILWYLEDLNKKDGKKYLDTSGAYHESTDTAKQNSRRDATGTYCKNHATLCPSTTTVITPRFAYNFSADLHRAFQIAADKRTAPDVPANVWKNNFTLAPGEYVLHVEVYNPAEGDKFLTHATRPFAVESRQPAVAIDYDTEKVDGSKATEVVRGANGFDWVKREFGVMVRADAGMGNFTGDPTVALKRKTVLPGQSLWLDVNFDTSSDVTRYDCGIACSTGNATRFINGTITLPSGVQHGRGFDVYFNFTTDLRQNNSVTSVKVATGPTTPNEFSVHLDEVAPTTRVDARVNATGFLSSQGPGCWADTPSSVGDPVAARNAHRCMLFGRISDPDSGADEVRVRIRDADSGSHWSDANGAWCTNCAAADAWFTLDDADVISLDNGTWWRYGSDTFHAKTTQFTNYVVDVRTTDRVGNAEAVKSFPVRYDQFAPVVKDATFRAEGGNALPTDTTSTIPFVSWQGQRAAGHLNGVDGAIWLFANVTDDACVAAISVVVENGTTGALIGKYPVTHPLSSNGAKRLTDAQCRTLGESAKSVRIAQRVPVEVQTLSGGFDDAPLLRTYMEVEDARKVVTNKTGEAGAARLVKSYFKVYDDRPPHISSDRASWTPGTAGQGGLSTLTVHVFENVGIENVEARIYRVEENAYDASKPLSTVNMTPDTARGGVAANGTGWYSIRSTDANVTLLKGEYAAHVVARDLEGRAMERRPIRLVVSDSAPPAVDLVQPPLAAGFVNATPHVYAVAYSLNMTVDGVSVATGDAQDNLTDVPSANLTVLGEENLAGKVAAYHVWYNGTVPTNASNWTVRVTARDLAGLVDTAVANFTVDREAPVVNASFLGAKDVNGTMLLNAESRLAVNATDALSGVADVVCRVDGGAAFNCADPVTLAASDGEHTVTVTAVDNVGNAAAAVALNVTLDKTAPTVSIANNSLTFVVTADDAGTGVDTVTVFHSSEASSPGAFSASTATRLAGNAYRVELPEDAIWYYVEVKDVAGNVQSRLSADAPGRIGAADDETPDPGETPDTGNTPPVLTILAPTDGGRFSGAIEVAWETTDADGDVVGITLSYEDASGNGRVIQQDLAGSAGGFSWDTSTLPDGTYTLIVRASDGTNVTEDSVTFTMEKAKTVTVRTGPRPIVKPGEQLPLAVDVESSKTVSVVRLHLYKDGERVQSLALEQQASDPKAYGLTLEPSEPGNYLAQVVVEYQDGSSDEPVSLGTFTVASVDGSSTQGGGFAFTMPLGMLLSVSLLTIGLAGWAGFVRWKP